MNPSLHAPSVKPAEAHRDAPRLSVFPAGALSTGLALLAAAAVLLPLLGHKALADWDEAIYAEVAREFLGRSWLVPHWHFQPWFEKPPLGFWITAVFFHLFRINEFWARAGSALAGVGLVGITHAAALRIRGAKAAWIATFILLTTFGFLRAARMGELDALLALGCYAALWGLTKVSSGNLQGWLWFWTGFAAAAMTKGAAGVTLLLTLLILLIWNRWGWRHLGRPFLLGLCLCAILVLPWHLYMLHVFGRQFLSEYLGLHVLARATTPIEGHISPWWYYAKVLLAYSSPWLFLFPFALWRALRKPDQRAWAVFAAVVLILFSAMATRSPKYIFPAYPALALVTGIWISEQIESRSRRWISAATVITLAAYGLATVATKPIRESLTRTKSSAGTILHADREPETLLTVALANPAAAHASEPILLWQEDVIPQLPSLLFSIRQPLQQVYLNHPPDTLDQARRYADPEPLQNFVTAIPHLVLLEPALAAELPPGMELHILARGRSLEAGTIRLTESK